MNLWERIYIVGIFMVLGVFVVFEELWFVGEDFGFVVFLELWGRR